MDRIKKNADVAPRPRGLAGDLHTLKAGGAASADELREFVRQLRGKDPQEMLGIVAQSGLAIGVVQATVVTAVVILAFTVVPYVLYKNDPAAVTAKETPAAATPTKVAEESPKTPAQVTAPSADPATTASTVDSKQPSGPKNDKGKILEKLGMDEAKKSDPNANPLENKADDLLKDLK